MRNDDVTPFQKIGKNSMQMSYGLYTRFLVDLAYLKEAVVNAFQLVSFMRKKRNFQPSIKWWKIIKHMTSKQQFLPEKWSKSNSTLHFDLLIECQIKDIVRKISRAVFTCHRSLMAPCKIIQCYDRATVTFDF